MRNYSEVDSIAPTLEENKISPLRKVKLPMFLKKGKTPASGKRSLNGKKIFLFLIPLLLVGYFLAFRPVFASLSVAKQAQEDLRFLKDGLLLQNMDQIKGGGERLQQDVADLKKATKPLVWTRVIPLVGGYYGDLQHFLAAGEHGTTALLEVIDALYPVASDLGFSVEGQELKEVGGQDKISTLLKIFPVLGAKLDSLRPEIEATVTELAAVKPSRYPENFRGLPLRSLVTQAQETGNGIGQSLTDLKTFLNDIPSVMGYGEPKKYLFLFQNDKELRPTGGFWTAYAIFTVEDGKIIEMQSDDMYNLDLDRPLSFYLPAPQVIQDYLKIDYWYVRDANLSPDYPTAVEALFTHLDRLPFPEVDGVMAVDTYFVEDLLGVLGEVSVPGYGESFNRENVVYQLELYSNVWGKNEAGRKNIVGDLMRETINLVFGMPGNKYDDFISTMVTSAQRKHLLLNFNDAPFQTLVLRYGFGGELKAYDGDYLHINDANLAGRKANWWMEESVTKEVKQEGGKWISELTIEYFNNGEYDVEWNTGYRDYVRVYVPQGATLISSDGSLQNVTTAEDLGKTVFAAYIGVQPGEKQTLTFKYELPSQVINGKEYKLLIQKQPGTEGYQYEVKADGKSEKFELSKDQEVVIKL